MSEIYPDAIDKICYEKATNSAMKRCKVKPKQKPKRCPGCGENGKWRREGE